jgi:hypothetical protein
MKSIILLAVVVIATACGSNKAKSADAACTGGSSCGQPCDVGNNLGVGRYCTKGGGECNKNDNGFIFCTIDEDPTAPAAFCTGVCGSDGDCGSDAYCDGSGSTGPHGCVPASCGGTPTDAGV